MEMANREHFNVFYDGPALDQHLMDVRDLAPALIAISDLFSEANKVLNKGSAEIRVEVKGSFKAGSFGIDLISAQHFLYQLKELFNSPEATAASNVSGIIALIGFSGSGLISLLRRLKGKSPSKIEFQSETSSATVYITNEEMMVVDGRVIELYKNKIIRTSIEKILSPLEKEGITNFGVSYKDEKKISVGKDELSSFKSTSTASHVINQTVAKKVLLIESVTFKDDNKWRVHDGQSPFSATMLDKEFIDKINNGERFGKGDVLVVELEQTQIVDNNTLKNEYSICRVYEHRGPLQAEMFPNSKPNGN